MKMLDPRSVVREGEFETVRKTYAIPDRVWLWFQQVKNARKLGPQAVAEIKSESKRLFLLRARQQREMEMEQEKFARDVGVDPGLIMRDYLGPWRAKLQKNEEAADAVRRLRARGIKNPTPAQVREEMK